MPLDPARTVGAYLRAQVYRDHPSGPPPAVIAEEEPSGLPAGSPSAAEPETPSAAPPEHAYLATVRPPGRLTRLLSFLRQGPAAAPDTRQP
ncbi:hypothetical protein [Streptomyces sp. NPDC051162]|uniref:hypothetical protein n=1 Tax=unclassified Streptomyces TaxID=2593676 RepID=UPI003416519A